MVEPWRGGRPLATFWPTVYAFGHKPRVKHGREITAMLTSYINAAMARAQVRYLDEDQVYFSEIPGLDGPLGRRSIVRGKPSRPCGRVLEEWIMVSLAHHLPIPPLTAST